MSPHGAIPKIVKSKGIFAVAEVCYGCAWTQTLRYLVPIEDKSLCKLVKKVYDVYGVWEHD
jgi:hypothetical protein